MRTTWLFPWIALALVALVAPVPAADGPLAPEASLARFKTPPDLAIDLVLSEPEITQPVFLDFDERGRLWVVEYRQYPAPAGLTLLSKDSFWRAVYDKVPPPPPAGLRGLDRITIHEDTDGDGRPDRHKTFVDGLNIATACARGRGGVFVLNPPYLLFYADRDNDDRPDGDPEVLLEGFGLEDTHSVVNSLRWGPDGWLYAAQGSTVTGRVRRFGSAEEPVHSLGQLIWRYHPETRRYEVFAEGGGNAFGVEIDRKGRIYSGHNGGDTRGFHYVQGGYYRKGFDKHGPLSNPYAFGYFDAMKHAKSARFTHNFVIEEGDNLPPAYRGKLFGIDPLQSHVVLSDVIGDGSTFRTADIGFPVTTDDRWFRPVDIKAGPDGALVVADWYDGQITHTRNYQGQMDRSNGRVYRLRAAGAKPVAPFDLSRKTTDELVDLLRHPNRWHRQVALRLLGDRRDASARPRLRAMAEGGTGQDALEALWGLHLSGGFDDEAAARLLGHADPFVRLWTIRLLGDERRASPTIAEALGRLARDEPAVEVRVQLAATARRLPATDGLPIVGSLIARDEDASDPFQPLLIWWAIEAKADSDREAVLGLFRGPETWSRPIARDAIVGRLMRRLAATGTRKDLLACVDLLRLAPGPDDVRRLMIGFEAAFAGRAVAGLPPELARAMASLPGGSILLGLREGDPKAVDAALAILDDDRADAARRLRCVQVLGEVDRPRAVPALTRLATRSADPTLRGSALVALRRYADPAIGDAVAATLGDLTPDLRAEALELLATRPAWALRLARAVDSGRVDPKSLPPDIVQRLLRHRDPDLIALMKAHFADVRPSTPAELQAEIDRVAAVLRAGPADPRAGEKLFVERCSGCHSLFGKGGRVGPDLTSYRRDDLDAMLLHVVNPSAEIREGYAGVDVSTADGRSLSGVLIDQDPRSITLRGGDGRDVVIPRDLVEEMAAARKSPMPEGLLGNLADDRLRDLFAYLRSSQPPK
ncbi:PVC-type heme-binding CxxCH protein [Tundrisphaera sp. TA3]|uniref:PVC-type heme-binding CxxCH protein n=1 Tax=Tundrisphaera sp. TA3 TaxID=3435775 RepID=UPI003EBF03D8